MSINYKRLVPPNTFIHDYMESMHNVETAHAYDFFCALWLMSLACRRDVIVDRPNAPVYMNMYCVLVAKSGVTRKSTAVGHARQFATEFMKNDAQPIKWVDGRTSASQFEQLLHEQSKSAGTAHAAISVSELVTFLGREASAAGMPGLLTDLYDCQRDRHIPGSLARSGLHMRNVYVTLLSASTPSWLLRSINPNIIEGGFTSRCWFVVAEDPKRRIAWGGTTDRIETHTGKCIQSVMGDLCARLVACAHQAHSLGRILPNANALDYFRTWYKTRKYSTDEFRASFESREDAHVLRIAGFLAINDGSYQISVDHLQKAIRVVDELKDNGARLFAPQALGNRVANGIAMMRQILIDQGANAIQHSDLQQKLRTRLSGAECQLALEVLHELGMVHKLVPQTHVKRGARPTYWRADKSIMSPRALETVVERMQS